MVGVIAIVVAAAWSALAVDTVVESARAGSGSIVVLRTTLLTPGVRLGVPILCGLAASAGLAMAAAVAHARGRRLERRMAAELDARHQEITARAAGDVARAGLLSWRVAELRTSMQELTGRRDQLLAEMEQTRRRTAELRALAEDYQRSLQRLQDRFIVMPEVEDELARRRAQRRAANPSA
jgi:hypothetical protein